MDEYYFDGNRGYRINYRSDYIVDNGYENNFENVNKYDDSYGYGYNNNYKSHYFRREQGESCCYSNNRDHSDCDCHCHRKNQKASDYQSYQKDNDHCDCHSDKKEHYDCEKPVDRKDKKFVKECICIDWSVPHNRTQTVYIAKRIGDLSASGFISYDCGSPAFITVTFLLGDHEVEEINVFRDSSVAFEVSRFNRIKIKCSAESSSVDTDCPDSCEGELCIKPRFFV